MDIQLVIRAPNQNIEDQVVTIQMDWTVLKLKKHLSEVYPNKPCIQEQKLIYSGHFLCNHVHLKDVIRHESGNSALHIMHLVCIGENSFPPREQNSDANQDLPNKTSPIQQSDRLSNVSEESPERLSNASEESPERLYNASEESPERLSNASEESSERLSNASEESSENILRYRGHSSAPPVNVQTQFPQIPVSAFPMYPTDPQMLAQMAAMQQMYVQYVTQYWQSVNIAASTGTPPVFPVISNFQPQQNNPNNATADAAPAQQPANQRLNAAADQANEENNEFGNNRDWLDQLFLYCRFVVLLSIVYFYSTPERFMLVILCMVIAFLYREGWFMRRTLAEAVMRHRLQHGVMQDPANNANERASNQDEVQDGHELEAAMDGEDPPHAQNPDVVNNNQVFSPLAFLVMFFSSLIPEPPPPVNLN